jgi:hypothetical protein
MLWRDVAGLYLCNWAVYIRFPGLMECIWVLGMSLGSLEAIGEAIGLISMSLG